MDVVIDFEFLRRRQNEIVIKNWPWRARTSTIRFASRDLTSWHLTVPAKMG